MKTHNTISSKRGFSAVDLLIVVATIVVIAGLGLQGMGRAKATDCRKRCVHNLREIGIGFRLYAADGEPYPKYNETNQAWQYFQTVGREIGSPRSLICPDDAMLSKRAAALDFEVTTVLTTNNFAHPTRQNNSLSYFHSPDASKEEPGTILAGDRNISTNQTTISGLLTVETNTPVQWTKGPHKMDGNILLADGSAQQVSTVKLRDAFRIQTNITQRVLIP